MPHVCTMPASVTESVRGRAWRLKRGEGTSASVLFPFIAAQNVHLARGRAESFPLWMSMVAPRREPPRLRCRDSDREGLKAVVRKDVLYLFCSREDFLATSSSADAQLLS